MEEERRGGGGGELVLVGRKGCFGLPTACPSSLPVYIYLRFAKASFNLHCDANNPDSDHVPYVEFDDCVIFNNENGGVIEGLKKEGIADLDSSIPTSLLPDWLSIKAMVCSWLYEAAQYELWVSSDGSVAHEIYYSGLSWPIGKALQWKQSRYFKNFFGITNINGEEKEAEIYRKAGLAYEALSLKLGEQTFFFDNRPTSLDAIFLGHVLFVLHALPDTSSLRNNLLRHDNLVRYSENLKAEFLETSSSSSCAATPSTPRRRASSYRSSKPKPKPKGERTEEEKTFRKRAKYFLATQLVAVLVFLSLFGGSDGSEMDEDGIDYDD
ncbi:mitochondrial outer membrane import complex protein METAXIN-like [Iris pallida]|uniref:Mitochondrial outer membrane import complex protein METAXIN-like n=1 Tax=Iris pallida TaxID=29817 RepID=A0AAX6EW81_IRIPA|nr:mitochondrial outer membrane import complex protein METAXIN-like [Iris pallida]